MSDLSSKFDAVIMNAERGVEAILRHGRDGSQSIHVRRRFKLVIRVTAYDLLLTVVQDRSELHPNEGKKEGKKEGCSVLEL